MSFTLMICHVFWLKQRGSTLKVEILLTTSQLLPGSASTAPRKGLHRRTEYGIHAFVYCSKARAVRASEASVGSTSWRGRLTDLSKLYTLFVDVVALVRVHLRGDVLLNSRDSRAFFVIGIPSCDLGEFGQVDSSESTGTVHQFANYPGHQGTTVWI